MGKWAGGHTLPTNMANPVDSFFLLKSHLIFKKFCICSAGRAPLPFLLSITKTWLKLNLEGETHVLHVLLVQLITQHSQTGCAVMISFRLESLKLVC